MEVRSNVALATPASVFTRTGLLWSDRLAESGTTPTGVTNGITFEFDSAKYGTYGNVNYTQRNYTNALRCVGGG